MQWTKDDTELYLAEKKYVDTLIIPLIPFNPETDGTIAKEAFQRELNHLTTHLLEKGYRGRILLAPDYNYITGNYEAESQRINQWIEKFEKQPFEHVFLFTFDTKWKRWEKELKGHLLWVPSLHERNLQSTETRSFVKEQVNQISDLIKAYWD
ncbi:hypothetical protein GCM10010954_04900 [Halobacillus andaensis]|uniref:DUF2487 domain-containing protein n=1 Tax=Halobacillus andaensis TaxID=1176239 RepID=A0A917AZ44_HALAA|nr:DUF2487 family protein [Halobacillus andaensis]MBP2003279.1 hypothetical protein [Halobacillus andaensis]GGF09469.1 hypothetical protein GCM10010954_04900 [Halobacillus andaensis]